MLTGNTSIWLDVFGRRMQVVRRHRRWQAYLASDDGKRRPVDGLVIPEHLHQNQVVCYIADICHEWASPSHNEVVVLKR